MCVFCQEPEEVGSTPKDTILRNHQLFPSYTIRLRPNTVIAHGMVRPIGVSENLQFCNLMRNTHSLHYDYQRYSKAELIVSGGFIMSAVLARASRDFGEIFNLEISATSHLGKLHPMEPLGAISLIQSITPIPETPFEEILVKTIAIKVNVVFNSLCHAPIRHLFYRM